MAGNRAETLVSADNLIAAGYRQYPPSAIDSGADALYQKCIKDERGKLYYVNFRQWDLIGCDPTFDTDVSCNTDSGGYAWLKFKEPTIEASERRAETLWKAAGGIYYEEWQRSDNGG